MEQIKNLLERIPVNLLVMLALAWIGWDYYDFVHSDSSPYAALKSQVETSQIQLKGFIKKKREMDEFELKITQRKFEMNEVLGKLASMKASIPESIDLASLIKTVHTEASRAGVVIESIRPGQVTDRENFGEQDFSVSFRGAFIQLLVFADKLSNMQKIMTVEELDLSPSGGTVSKHIELKGTLQVKTYRYLQSSADEIIKKMSSAGGP